MLKITFKTPQWMIFSGENTKVMFFFTNNKIVFDADYIRFRYDNVEGYFLQSLIQSIEHVKPTDL